MIITSDTSGIDALRRRIAEAKRAVPSLLQDAAAKSGETVSDWLSEASPHGRSGGGVSPGNDAPGPLAESYRVKAEQDRDGAKATVTTVQPLKLQYVVEGTGVFVGKGRIVPLKKRALYWKGAAHPVGSVAGQKGNDFVTPVLRRTDEAVEAEMDKVVQRLDEIMEG